MLSTTKEVYASSLLTFWQLSPVSMLGWGSQAKTRHSYCQVPDYKYLSDKNTGKKRQECFKNLIKVKHNHKQDILPLMVTSVKCFGNIHFVKQTYITQISYKLHINC